MCTAFGNSSTRDIPKLHTNPTHDRSTNALGCNDDVKAFHSSQSPSHNVVGFYFKLF